jgi:nicotinate-nucleotide adenylyltransferase
LVCAQEAIVQLGLDTVLWIPAGVPPHREIEQDPGAEARFEMVELTVSGDERFAASRIEIDREGPSYMSETLRQLRSHAPEDELFLLLGGDQASTLDRWHEPEEIFKLATVAVVERTGFRRDAISVKLASLLRGDRRVRFFDMPRVDVSSSMIRRRASSGLPIRYLVTDKVANFIGAQSLYGASVPVPVEAGE